MKYPMLFGFLATALPALLASCAKPAYEGRGYASCIADQYAGRYTSSGSVYQPGGWTAAHNSLPFGTVVKVKNNYNGRTVNVTVSDRFPNYPNRIINLSRAAAEYIQLPYHQLADVTVTAKTVPGSSAQSGGYSTSPPAPYQPHAGYGTPAPAAYTHAPKTPAYHSKPGAVPPAGYGTTAPPAGIPPPPPGYR